MPIPNISAFAARLHRTSADVLGGTIQYQAAGSLVFVPLQAHIDYGDQTQGFEAAQVIEQNISVKVLKADVPVKPAKAARLTLPKVPGVLFRPEKTGTSKSGAHWIFEVRIVPNG